MPKESTYRRPRTTLQKRELSKVSRVEKLILKTQENSWRRNVISYFQQL